MQCNESTTNVVTRVLCCATYFCCGFHNFGGLYYGYIILTVIEIVCRRDDDILGFVYMKIVGTRRYNRSGTFIVVRLSDFSGFQGVMFLVPSYRYSRKANHFNISPIAQCIQTRVMSQEIWNNDNRLW